MLKTSKLEAIYAALDESRLCRYDFELTPDPKDVSFKIRYLADPRFFLLAERDKTTSASTIYSAPSVDYSFKVQITPGGIATTEKIECNNFESTLKLVERWANLVDAEVRSGGLHTRVAAQARATEEFRKMVSEVPDEPIPDEKAAEWKAKLNELEEELKAKLAEHNSDKERLQKELSQLKSDFQFLRESFQSLTQRGWVAAAAAKIRKWSQNTYLQKALPAARDFQKRLLPELELKAPTKNSPSTAK